MKRLILIIIVCCRALGWCHANTQTETDSLYRVAQSLPHDSTRLEMFKRLAQIATDSQVYHLLGSVARGSHLAEE